MSTRQLVCLANSRKHGGCCVAGKVVEPNRTYRWIRPVGYGEAGDLTLAEVTLDTGHPVAPLDVVQVQLDGPWPTAFQKENHRVRPDALWRQVGAFPKGALRQLCDSPPTLWDIGSSSPGRLNDRVPADTAKHYPSSLFLVHVHAMIFEVVQQYNKLRVFARFQFRGVVYSLVVTDPIMEREYLCRVPGEYPVPGDAYLCVSLGLPYEGHAYKLVASVIR